LRIAEKGVQGSGVGMRDVHKGSHRESGHRMLVCAAPICGNVLLSTKMFCTTTPCLRLAEGIEKTHSCMSSKSQIRNPLLNRPLSHMHGDRHQPATICRAASSVLPSFILSTYFPGAIFNSTQSNALNLVAEMCKVTRQMFCVCGLRELFPPLWLR
jgi:hypothetical protein